MIGMKDKLRFFQTLHQGQVEAAYKAQLASLTHAHKEAVAALKMQVQAQSKRAKEAREESAGKALRLQLVESKNRAETQLRLKKGALYQALLMDLRKEIAKALDGPELFKKAKGIEDRRAAKLVSIDVDITRQDEAKALFACPCHPMEDSKGLILHFDDQSIEELTVDVLANLLQAPLSAVFLEALAGLKQGGQA